MITGKKSVRNGACTGLHERALLISQNANFKASARPKSLLLYLCEHAEKDPDGEVSQKSIAIEVLGLNENFDPVANVGDL